MSKNLVTHIVSAAVVVVVGVSAGSVYHHQNVKLREARQALIAQQVKAKAEHDAEVKAQQEAAAKAAALAAQAKVKSVTPTYRTTTVR